MILCSVDLFLIKLLPLCYFYHSLSLLSTFVDKFSRALHSLACISVWKCNELHLMQSYWIPGHEKSNWLVNSVTCDLIICCFPVFVQMVLLAVFSSGQVTNPLVIIPCHSGKHSKFYCWKYVLFIALVYSFSPLDCWKASCPIWRMLFSTKSEACSDFVCGLSQYGTPK